MAIEALSPAGPSQAARCNPVAIALDLLAQAAAVVLNVTVRSIHQCVACLTWGQVSLLDCVNLDRPHITST